MKTLKILAWAVTLIFSAAAADVEEKRVMKIVVALNILVADIAIIDLDNFRPIADYKNPTELSTGISELLVNGKLAITGGQYTGALPGSVINRQQLQCPE